jgi:hypothetical protein
LERESQEENMKRKSKILSAMDCKEKASKYTNRTKFKIGDISAYRMAKKLNIFDEICAHMENPNKVRFMSDGELIEYARPFASIKQLKRDNRGVYRGIVARNIQEKAFSHMEDGGYTCYPWTDEELALEASKSICRGHFQSNSSNAYQVAKRRGILDKICAHMESRHTIWDYYKLKIEASLHTSRVSFQKNSKGAYMSATNMGILDEICSHMEYICYPWTDEELAEEALKYVYRSDFYKYGEGAYHVASNRGILEELCKHMKPSLSSSLPEREIYAAVKELFPLAKKLRDRKVKIEDKPHIKGFDIDIFIPELNLGIEYDSKRFHSFEYMRKDRFKKLWSDEDIRNYHEIKDAWFTTKGIKILHIKEEDWLADEQACIDKCLEFLKS